MPYKNNIKRFACLMIVSGLSALTAYSQAETPVPRKPSIIVLTDIGGGDPDDRQSLVRFLLYANEYDVKAICATASLGHDPGVHPEAIKDQIAAYGKVYSHLIKNARGYPSPEYLFSAVYSGRANYADFGKGLDSDASNRIIQIVQTSDTLVNIVIWGGQRELAQALWKVKNTGSPQDAESFCKKIRVFAIGDQDRHQKWILDHFRNIQYIAIGYAEVRQTSAWRGMYVTGNTSMQDSVWVKKNIHGKGPLGACYPLNGAAVNGMKEGDSPSFLRFIQNGLNFPGHPEWGGWGGRYRKVKTLSFNHVFIDAPDILEGTINERHSVSRWRVAFQRDFMARIDWCTKPYHKANHNPVVVVNGSPGYSPLYVNAKRGELLEFNAGESTDPDGNSLSYRWFIYNEISGTAGQCIDLKTSGEKCAFSVPGISGKNIHLILEVTDNGSPRLTTYKRIIIHIKEE